MGPRHPINTVTPVPSDSIVSDSTSFVTPQDWDFVEERLSPSCAGPQITSDQQVIHVDPSNVLLCDLGNKALSVEDLANALRLWSRPAVLIAAHNEVEHLPSNIPPMILFLDLSWNRLTSLDGFATLRDLRELDVSHNALHSMLGLVANTELRVLRLAHNRIRRVEGLEQLKLLEEVDLSYNLLRTTTDVRALSLNAGLRDLRMEGNPLCVTGVPHGSIRVHMHHLLPGATLLHGESRAWAACSSSAPPPPSPACSLKGDNRVAVESRTASSSRRSRTRSGGRTHAVGVRDNLGSSRRWHDPRLLHNLCHVHGGYHWRTGKFGHALRVMAPGRHRLTKARGSYAKMHLASLRKSSEATTALTEEAARGVPKENTEHRRRRIEPSGSKAQSQAPPPAARGRQQSPEAREGRPEPTQRPRSRNLPRGCTVAAPSSSIFPPKGSSRAQRAAARRLAWNQARQEGRVGTATSGVRSAGGSLRRNTAQSSSNPSTRAKVTFVMNLSRCRQEPASYATVEPNTTNEGEGALLRNGSPQIGRHCSHRQLHPRARLRRTGEARSGDKGSSRQGSAGARAESKSIDCRASADRLRDHRGRRRGHSVVIAGVGRGPERRRSSSTENRVQGRRSRENSLRQRNRRTSRPTAPPVSRSLPREDATPRRGFAQSGYDGGLQRDRNIHHDLDGWRTIGSDAPRGREYGRTAALEHQPNPLQPTQRGGDEAGGYLHPEVNKDGSDGTQEQPSARLRSLYVSPLSPEGILQRASAAIQAAGSHSISLVDAARPYRWQGGFFGQQEGTTGYDPSGWMQCWGDQRTTTDHVGEGTMRDHELSSSPEDGLRLPYGSPPEREACCERRAAREEGSPTERVVADRMHHFPEGGNIDGHGVRGPGRTSEPTSSRLRGRNSNWLCRVAWSGEGQSNSDAASCVSDHGTSRGDAEAKGSWHAAQESRREPLGFYSEALEEEMDTRGESSGARPIDRLEANDPWRNRSRNLRGKIPHERDVDTEILMTSQDGRREQKSIDRAVQGRAADGTTHKNKRADRSGAEDKTCYHHPHARVVRHGSAPERLKHDTRGVETGVSLRGAPHDDQVDSSVRGQEDVESFADTTALEEGIVEMIASILLEDER